jgi:hypothetical protein
VLLVYCTQGGGVWKCCWFTAYRVVVFGSAAGLLHTGGGLTDSGVSAWQNSCAQGHLKGDILYYPGIWR